MPLVDPKAYEEGSEITRGVPAIQNWNTRQDQVLALHLAGYRNRTIASQTGYTETRVSQIIHDPRAQMAIGKFRERVAVATEREVTERIVALTPTAMDRIAETLIADMAPGTHGKRHQDTTAFKLLALAGHSEKNLESASESGISLTGEAATRLSDALAKSAGAYAAFREPVEIIIEAETADV